MSARRVWTVVVCGACLAALAGISLAVASGAPNQAGMPASAKAMRPGMAPSFLPVGSIVTLVLVKKELTAEILEIDPIGWVKIRPVGDDDDIKGTPWLNLNHVTLVYTTRPKEE